jgi:hypothetical protein
VLKGDVIKVIIFDYNMTEEVVKRCTQNDPALTMIDE